MWEQAKWVDHYLADCVLVGGVRRAARIATKWWKDPGIFDFINSKRPNKLVGLSVVSQIRDARKEDPYMHGFLWTANNSITVDKEFWDLLAKRDPHAVKVFDAATLASYADGTGEPAFINVDKLHDNDEGLYEMLDTDWFGSSRYQPTFSKGMLADISERFRSKKYKYIVNPCAEIVLSLIGAYCVIADVVPFHAETLEEAEDAFRAATRALIRVNTMDSMYRREVERTNRIGVGITGLHEFAWKGFRLGFRDLLDLDKSAPFWETLQRFSQAVRDEATAYSNQLGVAVPHTFTTIKPAGTTSKLFGLTEGCHLPSMGCYMRWVQFKTGNELIAKYEKAGYPTRELQTYSGVTIVGFPTKPTICDVIPEENIVYAGDATPQEQYEFLRLLEKYWIGECGNQISYTLKYKPENTTYEAFKDCLLRNQPTIKCCSVMPQEETISYEYSPESPITLEEYNEWMEIIKPIDEGEDVAREHLECEGGACPIEYREDSGAVSTAVSD
jgi:ribonucleoside-triphosphate reductase (formate)